MKYSDEIKTIIDKEMNNLLNMIKTKQDPFNFTYINNYIMKYFELIFDETSKDGD